MSMYYVIVRRENKAPNVVEISGDYPDEDTALSYVRAIIQDRTVISCEVMRMVAIISPKVQMTITREGGTSEFNE